MVVITTCSELVEASHAIRERRNVQQPQAGDLALAIDIEKQIATDTNCARLTSFAELEMNHTLRAVGLGDEWRVDLDRGDVRLRPARRQTDTRIFDLVRRRECGQLAHVWPHRDLAAVDAPL